jgi:hypothetical protein
VARPIGATFATLGIAGLLLTSIPAFTIFGSAGASPANPAATEQLEIYSRETQGAGVDQAGGGDIEAQPQDQRVMAGEDGAAPDAATTRTADPTLAVLSGSFLIVGIGLLGLRWTARQLGDG